MGKLKTKKGVAKRFSLTKRGKVKYAACGKSHLMSNKNRKRLRSLKKPHTIDGKKEVAFVKKMLPYG